MTTTLYDHWSEVPASAWRWPSFTPREIASKGDGSLLLVPEAMDRLQSAREIYDQSMLITSAYRDPIHNARVGGAPRSMHKRGIAFDIALQRRPKQPLIRALEIAGFAGLGVRYRTFVHADCGRKRSW
jgi:uncharacterized protein YcbK (DUF882 family)